MILQDKQILVTGGTGSLGKILVRRLLSGELGTPRKVVVLSRDEAKQHDMRLEYLHRAVTTDEVIFHNFQQVLEFRIGDVRDFHDVCSGVKGADIVINAAALKQVPTCEYFPEQAVLTNCVGAANIVRAIRENGYGVESVVGVSTDKACKPVNVMGMSKAIQERIFISANILTPETRYICVRYGNVLASRGSVNPLVPRADPPRRSGDRDRAGDDPISAEPRAGGGHRIRCSAGRGGGRDLCAGRSRGHRHQRRQGPHRQSRCAHRADRCETR